MLMRVNSEFGFMPVSRRLVGDDLGVGLVANAGGGLADPSQEDVSSFPWIAWFWPRVLRWGRLRAIS